MSSAKICLFTFANGTYAGLSALFCLFFMIGAIGNTSDKDTMQNIPWLYVTYKFNNGKINYYSLKAEYVEAAGSVHLYADCVETRCEKCNSDGHSAYILVVISCLSALACAAISAMLMSKPDFRFAHFLTATIAAFATLMSGIALSLFMGDCQNRLTTYAENASTIDFDFHWGAASILTATGMCFMFLVSVGTFIVARCCAGQNDQTLLASEPEEVYMTAV